jgi:hypothetical protein
MTGAGTWIRTETAGAASLDRPLQCWRSWAWRSSPGGLSGRVEQTAGFFGAGAALLASTLTAVAWSLQRGTGRLVVGRGWVTLGRLGLAQRVLSAVARGAVDGRSWRPRRSSW